MSKKNTVRVVVTAPEPSPFRSPAPAARPPPPPPAPAAPPPAPPPPPPPDRRAELDALDARAAAGDRSALVERVRFLGRHGRDLLTPAVAATPAPAPPPPPPGPAPAPALPGSASTPPPAAAPPTVREQWAALSRKAAETRDKADITAASTFALRHGRELLGGGTRR
jgi:hypothetical protein